jgi:PAS domain S-box-containing protein
MAAKRTSARQPPDLLSLCRAITEHAPTPVAAVEGGGGIVRYVNPAFCRLFEKSSEQLVGIPFYELLPDRDECVRLFDRVFRTGKPESHTEQEHAPTGVPSHFEIMMDAAKQRRQCTVRWRSENAMGVSFDDAELIANVSTSKSSSPLLA